MKREIYYFPAKVMRLAVWIGRFFLPAEAAGRQNDKNNFMKQNFYVIIREIFYALTFALFIFVIMELFFPNIVQAYIKLNLVLILWFLSGIMLLYAKRN
jgi:hypothetical protein